MDTRFTIKRPFRWGMLVFFVLGLVLLSTMLFTLESLWQHWATPAVVDSPMHVAMFFTGLGLVAVMALGFFVDRRINHLIRREAHHSLLIDAMMQNAPCGIGFLDTEFRFVQVNSELERLNRLSAEKHRGKFLWEVLPELWPHVAPKLKDVVLNGATHVFEVDSKAFRQNSPRTYFLVSYFPVRQADQKLIGVGIIVSDITQNKENEVKLGKLAQDLQRSNKELERFAYLASHDLKEPLRMISTYLGVFMDQYGPSIEGKGRVYLGYASEGAVRLGKLIDALLRFSRIGTQSPEKKVTALSSVVDEAVLNLKAVVQESNAQIACEPLPVVCVDRMQFGILFQNLLANAVKFRNKNTAPQIKISSQRVEFGVVVSVVDNGIGVKEVNSEKIFEIFRRAHARTEYPGEGIGLAACKRIVEAHGGTIWVEPSPAGGSQFCFSLPDSLLEETRVASA